MATIAAIRWNPVIRTCYRRWRAAGKPPKVAIVAGMYKRSTILQALVTPRNLWRAA